MSHGTYKWVIAHVDEPSVCVRVHASSEVERGCRPNGHFAKAADWMDMAYMSESWHIWMSHGASKYVMAHMDESWHTLSGLPTDGLCRMDTAYTNEAWLYAWVMAHINESWHTFQRLSIAFAAKLMRHANNTNESWHILMSHGPYEWVISHIAGATDWLRRMDTAYIQPKIRTSRGKSRYTHSF